MYHNFISNIPKLIRIVIHYPIYKFTAAFLSPPVLHKFAVVLFSPLLLCKFATILFSPLTPLKIYCSYQVYSLPWYSHSNCNCVTNKLSIDDSSSVQKKFKDLQRHKFRNSFMENIF